MKNIIEALEKALQGYTMSPEFREEFDRVLDALPVSESREQITARAMKETTQRMEKECQTPKPKWIAPDGTECEWMEIEVSEYNPETDDYYRKTIGVYGKILEEENPGELTLGEMDAIEENPQPGKLSRLFNTLCWWQNRRWETKGKSFGETFKD